ncbi:hypothetical protein ARGLB_094_00440 [Arthrobacter globiformis NBRC 12137]|uniref:Uncharacterized protein n=2 Tax=Arthrobacter globiformis TaxID=1665 RepID=H0QSV7_ARTG1|nr:hypothetical protein ARGLB_094_00440 [Arthrobacter globiformis NBRC 12137]
MPWCRVPRAQRQGNTVPHVPMNREDWAHLVGGIVEVRLNGTLIRVGRVIQATADSSMLWTEADAVEQRTLYSKACGYEVRPRYALGGVGRY